MGRYLCAGIMTKFEIRREKVTFQLKDFDFKKEVDKVLKELNKTLDTSLYELTNKSKECYEYTLKFDALDNNIHELIREISPLICPNANYFYDFESEFQKLNNESFIKDYPFKSRMDSKGNYYIDINDETIKEDCFYYPLYWAIDDIILLEEFEINAASIVLWTDWNKYSGEDETQMIKIINTMKSKYYNSPLSKALIFYVMG